MGKEFLCTGIQCIIIEDYFVTAAKSDGREE